MKLDSPIFIVGYGHSGTTLLQNIIAKHPSIMSFNAESKNFEFLPTIKTQFLNLDNPIELHNAVVFAVNSIYYSVYNALKAGNILLKQVEINDKDIQNILQKPISNDYIFKTANDYITLKNKKREEGITTQSIGRWKNILSNSEVAICQKFAKEEIIKFEYSFEKLPFLVFLKYPLLLFKSSGEIFYRLYKRWKMGGNIILINTIKGYIFRFKKLKFIKI